MAGPIAPCGILRRVLLGLMIAISVTRLQPVAAAEPDIDFNRQIRPLLSDNCFHCHGPDKETRAADLRLDTRDGLFRAADGIQIVAAGKPAASELIARISSDDADLRMPPADAKRHLSATEIELIRRWVEQGAPWQQHWAFVPPQRPSLPPVQQSDWPLNAVDHFVLARLEQERLSPNPPADRIALLRRVSLDLTGLPPTLGEVDAYLADDSDAAYLRAVDRLLASPRYGERMVWDWLDAARYADTNGYQGDPERTMWPWRDWAVRALNNNMPYDQFTIEQLAGDLLPDATLDQQIATGFNRNHMFNGEGGRIAEETRIENVVDRTDTTATIWLGATLGCARCHDHKYDPFTQREYYQLFAFFNNTSESGGARTGQIAPVVDVLTAADISRRGELEQAVKSAAEALNTSEQKLFARPEGKPASESPAAQELEKKLRDKLAKSGKDRSTGDLDELAKHFKESKPEYSKLLSTLKRERDARDKFNRGLTRVMVMDELKQPRETHILVRGAYDKPAEKVTTGVPSILPPLPADQPANRLALARWLVDPQHPLTARVTVNRYWQVFFGTGLVKTVEDFGAQGAEPSHPQLLDWLASEFVSSGWNVKHIHRLLVTSATYRQSSKLAGREELLERDPENRLLARASRFRMPSWMLRDQALCAAGLLAGDLGGPAVKPYQPAGIWAEATFGKKKYTQDTGESLYRRSLYTFWRRIVGPTMFFDSGSRQTCTVKAVRTNTPLHALATLNDVTYVESARHLAALALREAEATPAARITLAFRRLATRQPSAQELEILSSRLEQLEQEFAADKEAATQLLSVGDSPRDEAIDPVEHAALTALCTLLLNLDETLSRQ